MDVKPTTESKSIPSLLRGGPFYRAQLATRLIKSEQEWNDTRRAVIAIVLCWAPLVLLTVFFNPSGLLSLLTSYRVYSRLLIAVPVLLIGQKIIETRFQMVVQTITDAHLLGDSEMKRLDDIIAFTLRLRDSFVPEAMIVFLLVAHTIAGVKTQIDTTPWLAYGVEPDVHLTAAGWYAVIVSTTVFQFLLGLSLWKWLLWTVFAFQLSRLDFNLVPTHPDHHGGLAFLGLTTVAFTPISFAASTVIGANWRHEILTHGAKLMSFKLDAIVLVIIMAIIALGPLVFFIPRLARLRYQGILDYGVLGQIQSTEFDEKWIHCRAGHEAELLTAPESSSLADFGSAASKVADLQPFPVDRGALIGLALSIGIPLLPAVLAVIPLIVVIQDLLKAMR
jgi:hypothetical protein